MKAIKSLAVIYLLVMVFIIGATAAEGKVTTEKEFRDNTLSRHGEYWSGGNLFIYKHGRIQTGWVRWKGATYYCHKTGSKNYPRGSATRGQMRVKRGKFYAFAWADCKQITEDYYYRYGPVSRRLSLKINKDGSVRYVYNTSACFGYRRYNCKERRYQDSQPDNTWKTVPGMQFIPDYVDTQK